MVYTVTFNPAIDYVVGVGELKGGQINRAASEQVFFGGKGINVSLVLAELGIRSRALGFVAGFTGRAIEDGIRSEYIETDFVHLSGGFSRINVKIKSAEETELNGQGPEITESDVERLFEKLNALQSGDTLVLAGSIPASLPQDIYERILAAVSGRGIRTVVDATKGLLLNVLKYKPFLIKPNHIELGELFGVTLSQTDEIVSYAQKLRDMGAQNVLVSRAGDGAVLVDENGAVHSCGVYSGVVRNSVGAGDSMLAGFLAGCESGDYDYALRLGTAAGGATAFSDGLATKAEIFRLQSEQSAPALR
ncbi:MAG: 1-phosphofructokinase [Oscillospiraceae bacterium]